jgi:hypothetical protein
MATGAFRPALMSCRKVFRARQVTTVTTSSKQFPLLTGMRALRESRGLQHCKEFDPFVGVSSSASRQWTIPAHFCPIFGARRTLNQRSTVVGCIQLERRTMTVRTSIVRAGQAIAGAPGGLPLFALVTLLADCRTRQLSLGAVSSSAYASTAGSCSFCANGRSIHVSVGVTWMRVSTRFVFVGRTLSPWARVAEPAPKVHVDAG